MQTLTLVGAMAYSLAQFGEGIGPIVLDDVQCNPSIHRRLLDCPHPGLRQHNCRHSEDAGVSCSPCMIIKILATHFMIVFQSSVCYIRAVSLSKSV